MSEILRTLSRRLAPDGLPQGALLLSSLAAFLMPALSRALPSG